jgi:hypothetical protein
MNDSGSFQNFKLNEQINKEKSFLENHTAILLMNREIFLKK